MKEEAQLPYSPFISFFNHLLLTLLVLPTSFSFRFLLSLNLSLPLFLPVSKLKHDIPPLLPALHPSPTALSTSPCKELESTNFQNSNYKEFPSLPPQGKRRSF